MNNSRLLLMPLAAVALLSGAPSTSKTSSNDLGEVAAVLERPEIRSLIDQIRELAGFVGSPEDVDASGVGRQARVQAHEQGLRTSHLSAPQGYYSAARGITPQGEWEQMFPRRSAKLASLR